MNSIHRVLPALLLVLICSMVLAATPPPLINYQGVLRDASGTPLTGTYDMVFTFYSDISTGDQILIDTHAVAGTGSVVANGGLFSTPLGSGALTDGAGPGTYSSLTGAFRDYATVWVEVQVGTETLSPRVRVVSSAYALNADSLDGRPASEFLDTTASTNFKSGRLAVGTGGTATIGISAFGT